MKIFEFHCFIIKTDTYNSRSHREICLTKIFIYYLSDNPLLDNILEVLRKKNNFYIIFFSCIIVTHFVGQFDMFFWLMIYFRKLQICIVLITIKVSL